MPIDSQKVEGAVAPGFEPVRDAFERNFTERGEIGASLCVYRGAEKVIDLWGGLADPAVSRPWTQDTMALVFSATKGATAILAHRLRRRDGRADRQGRVAALVEPPPPSLTEIEAVENPLVSEFALTFRTALTDLTSLQARTLTTNGVLPAPHAETWNDPEVRAMEQPAANGITDARSLAKM